MDILDTFEKYLNQPREQAYNVYLDEKNVKIFKVIVLVNILIFGIMLIVNIADLQTLNLALFITTFDLILLSVLRIMYRKFINVENVRKYIFVFLIVQFIAILSVDLFYPEENNKLIPPKGKEKSLIHSDSTSKNDFNISIDNKSDDSFLKYFFFFAVFVFVFRFSRVEILQLFVTGLAIPLILTIVSGQGFSPNNVIPNMMFGALFFFIAFSSEKKRRKKFFDRYNFYYDKNYENLRMKKELNYAREIQLSMLPDSEATINDLNIAGISLPASEVGGDYFDYFEISENQVGIFICDVSGHGVASGLMLSALRSSMHLILEDVSDPKIVIEKLNRMLRKTQNKKMFVTAIFAIIDLEKSKCMLYNAGHLPPYKISGESREIFKIKKHGIALGAVNNIESNGNENEVVFDFRKNDMLILYTDGLNEAMNTKKEEYGLDNLEFFLNNNADKSANNLLNSLIEDVKRFSENTVQRDDLTLLIVQRN